MNELGKPTVQHLKYWFGDRHLSKMENTPIQVSGNVPGLSIGARALDGVLWRRVLAFLVDYVIIGLLVLVAAVLVFILGILTLGAGWLLYAILFPAVVAGYVWMTLGGSEQATIGMRVLNLRIERMDGTPIDGLTAVVHTMLFWAFNAVLTPLVLLATLFLDYKRTLHDLLLGTVVVRSDF